MSDLDNYISTYLHSDDSDYSSDSDDSIFSNYSINSYNSSLIGGSSNKSSSLNLILDSDNSNKSSSRASSRASSKASSSKFKPPGPGVMHWSLCYIRHTV